MRYIPNLVDSLLIPMAAVSLDQCFHNPFVVQEAAVV
jgi:hypothetical protein